MQIKLSKYLNTNCVFHMQFLKNVVFFISFTAVIPQKFEAQFIEI